MDYKAYEEGQNGDSFWDIADNQLKDIMLTRINYTKPIKILNIGCGTAEDTAILTKHGTVYLSDIDYRPLKNYKGHKIKMVADAQTLPIRASEFDVICMFGSLEHIEDDVKALDEAARILKPGGMLFITGPSYQWLYSSHDKALLHFRRYTNKEIRKKMFKFQEIFLSHWNFILFLPIAILKLKDKNKEARLHEVKVSKTLNYIILKILEMENNLFVKNNIPLPYGANFYGIYKKR